MEPLRGKWLGPLVGALTGVLIVGAAALGVTATTDGGSGTSTTAQSATTNGSTTGTTPQRGGAQGDADHAERHAQMEKVREAMDACLTERGVDVPERPEPGTRPEGPPPELDAETRAAIEACHEELEGQGLAPGGRGGKGHHGEDGDHGPMRGHRGGGGPMGHHGPGEQGGQGQQGEEAPGGMQG